GSGSHDAAPDEAQGGDALFTRLKALRSKLAASAGIPAYLVFTDAALRDMCRKQPTSLDDFLEVSGVGKSKAEKYGKIFLGALREGGV
ncbi:MAG: ATP-dependent DNA helicase RecQ, partial [Clostridiaceae bacterium]|nr:ATP-dependent DNA helicase RecQ [Clostridiaceae bacterium]